MDGRRLGRAIAAAVAVAMLVLAAPASAHASDLFPVDDWLGAGIKKSVEVAFGPLKLGAEQIARLLATIVGALADLLVPKSLVRAGLDGIRWLVQLPPVGTPVSAEGAVVEVRMPHLIELKGVLTWIGITLLPLGLIVGAGRALMFPTAESEHPAEFLQRALIAGFGLVIYDWAWGAAVQLSRLVTDALLGLPWVADGVEQMLETLVIGGASGTAVAAEFVIPLLLLAAGGALLALLLLRVALDVMTCLLYALGGLALGVSVTGFGRRLLAAWLVGAGAVALLPVLWATVFATGAALMLDTSTRGGPGFAGFVAQLYNVAAALAVFAVAIKLARALLGQAGGAIHRLANAPPASSGAAGGARGGGAGAMQRWAQHATPAGVQRFSRAVRGGARAAGRALAMPVTHPLATAGAAAGATGRSVQATRAGAEALRGALASGGPSAVADVARTRASRLARGAHGPASAPRPGAAPARGPQGPASAPRPGMAPSGTHAGPTAPSGSGLASTNGAAARPTRVPPAGGRRARMATARDARRARSGAAAKDWSQPRPLTGGSAAGSRATTRLAGARPWWLDKARVIARSTQGQNEKRGGDRRGR